MSFPIADLYDFILPHVPIADTPVVDHAIVRAVRMVAMQSGIQRATLTVPTVVGQYQYSLTAPAGTEIDNVVSVRIFPTANPDTKGIRLYQVPQAVADDMLRFNPALPTSWTYLADTLSVYPIPSTADSLSVVVILRPELSVVAPLDDIYRHHREIIADGAMAFLYAMPAKPWTNQQAAQEAYARFGRAILALRARQRGGGQSSHSTLSGVTFGA